MVDADTRWQCGLGQDQGPVALYGGGSHRSSAGGPCQVSPGVRLSWRNLFRGRKCPVCSHRPVDKDWGAAALLLWAALKAVGFFSGPESWTRAIGNGQANPRCTDYQRAPRGPSLSRQPSGRLMTVSVSSAAVVVENVARRGGRGLQGPQGRGSPAAVSGAERLGCVIAGTSAESRPNVHAAVCAARV